MTTPTAGHNNPPVVLPKDEEMLADLQNRYPEIDTRLKEWDEAFAGFPDDIPLEQEDVAQSLQDLIGQVKKETRTWDAHQKGEKKPLNALVKIVTNFFTTRSEKADKLLEKYGPIHQAFLDKKKAESIRKAEEEAAAQRKKEEEARAAAAKAEEERLAAEARAAEQRKKEEEARAAAEKAEEERKAAVARAEAAAAEEKRLAEEKKVRDREEKERNNTNLREIRGYMRRAEALHTLAEAEEINEAETLELDGLVKTGGIVGNLAAPVAASLLLDEEQKTSIEGTRTRLGELRTAISDRLGKREKAKREKAEKEAKEREDKLAEENRLKREEEEKQLAEARKKREEEEAAAARAREDKTASLKAAREADEAARGHAGEAKGAAREAKAHGTDADRAANRGNRIETQLEKSTDADHSRTRGDLGTVGSLTRRWTYHIVDEAALRAGFIVTDHPAPSAGLAEHLTTSALEGAVFHWMRAHQGGWSGQERVEGLLPGVVFAYEQEARIA